MGHHCDIDHASKLQNFDDLFVGSPVQIEKNLRELLPQASALEDKSIYLQVLSQIALAQAMQKRFDDAHSTLNTLERLLTPKDHLAQVRILLERGRLFMQEGDYETAKPFFVQSYELSKVHHFDYHTANAAHMIAMIATTSEDKIKWNILAIELVESSTSMSVQDWRGSLYNNLGHAYIEGGFYGRAFDALITALELRTQEGYAPNIRVAKWAVARSLRLLSQPEEALAILLPLVKEYESMVSGGEFDLPIEVLPSIRGLVYEELAEIYTAEAKRFAGLAYDDLSKDEWFKKLEPKRLERLKQFQRISF